MIKKIFTLALMALGCLSSAQCSVKLFFESEEIDFFDDKYYLHLGYNKWLSSSEIFEEDGEIFVYSDSIDINLDNLTGEYVNKWCCPYCHYYWPEQQPCQNKECPRHYGKKKDKERTNNRNETNVNRHDNEYDNRHLRDPVKPIKQPVVKHPPTNRKPITVAPVTRSPITTNRF
jgi:hypothetical protein